MRVEKRPFFHLKICYCSILFIKVANKIFNEDLFFNMCYSRCVCN